MRKILTETKDYLMDIHTTSYAQISNYIILVILAVFIKIFYINMIHTEFFTTGFEIGVWAFMIIWLILRALHSLNMLQGYYSLAGVPALLFILIGTSDIYLLHISMAIVVIGKCVEVKDKLFAKRGKDE